MSVKLAIDIEPRDPVTAYGNIGNNIVLFHYKKC